MAKKQLKNPGLVLVAIVAIVAIFAIFYMSTTMTAPTQQTPQETNLAGEAVRACSIDTQAISDSCGRYNYLYGSSWDECFQKTALSQYKEQGCIN